MCSDTEVTLPPGKMTNNCSFHLPNHKGNLYHYLKYFKLQCCVRIEVTVR